MELALAERISRVNNPKTVRLRHRRQAAPSPIVAGG